MSLARHERFLLSTITCLILANTCAAQLLIDGSNLGIDIEQSGGAFQQNILHFGPSPWSGSHIRAIGTSTIEASYFASWSGDSADFHVDTQHEFNFRGETITAGGFAITPAVESLFEIQGQYHYDQPPSILGLAGIQAKITVQNVPGYVFLGDDGGGTFTIDNPSPNGLLLAGGQAQLQPGVRYLFEYILSSKAFEPLPPNTALFGEGFINMTVRPIPEPAALLPLAIVALLTLAPGRRRKSEISLRQAARPPVH